MIPASPDLSKKLLSVGKFAQVTSLSIKTLHFWDEVGLLRPAFVDPENGYRYYTADQMTLVGELHYLSRLARLPLEEVQVILGIPPKERTGLFQKHLKRLEQEIGSLQGAKTLVEAFILHPEKQQYVVEPRELPHYSFALIRMRSGFDGDRLSSDRNKAFDEIYSLLQHQGVTTIDTHFCEWHRTDKWDDTDFAVWMCVPIEGVFVPEGRVEVDESPAGLYACTSHQGHYYFLGQAHTAIAQYLQEQGRPMITSREYYLYGPRDTDILEHHRTEVCYKML